MPLKDRSNKKLLRKFININYKVENSHYQKLTISTNEQERSHVTARWVRSARGSY